MSADVQSPPAEAPPPSALKKQLPFIVALVAGLGAGGASGAFFVGPAMAKGITPAVVAAAASHSEDAGGAEEDSESDTKSEGGGKEGEAPGKQVYTLDNLVLNPAESGGSRFLLLSIAFESNKAALVDEMKSRDAELRDVVLVTLGAKTVEQLADVKVRESIKQELATAALGLLKKKGTVHVYFPQFVIQ